jgi:SAM-dependent methyltransferase
MEVKMKSMPLLESRFIRLLKNHIVKPIYYKVVNLVPTCLFRREHTSLDRIHSYWKQPWDGSNAPESYLERSEKSKLLLELLEQYVTHEASVFELGCNVGRNLNYLYRHGWKDLHGVEISEKAIMAMRKYYPELAMSARIHVAAIEEAITRFRTEEFDVVFTMAVLEHIHIESEWVFSEIVRITGKYLITIEDEAALTWRHFRRDYAKVFGRLGMREVYQQRLSKKHGFNAKYYARVFEKPTRLSEKEYSVIESG